ncbi:hypothetical protein OAO87_01870 [bacterium]|nr:hypothetical protein [bacterium]
MIKPLCEQKGGAWREASMVLLNDALRAGGDAQPMIKEEGHNRDFVPTIRTTASRRLGKLKSIRTRRSPTISILTDEETPPALVQMEEPGGGASQQSIALQTVEVSNQDPAPVPAPVEAEEMSNLPASEERSRPRLPLPSSAYLQHQKSRLARARVANAQSGATRAHASAIQLPESVAEATEAETLCGPH